MIVGVGLDVTEIARISALIERWGERFTKRVFTPAERTFSDARGVPARHYAARFAAKEAALKALGVPERASWHEMEVVGGGGQPPRLVLGGVMAAAAARLGAEHLHLSITHGDEIAAAVVIAERG